MRNLFCTRRVFVFFLILGVTWPLGVQAGNRAMIEREIKKMDTLNKKIVEESVKEIPKDGVISTRAKVQYKDGEISFKVTGQQVAPVKEETIEFKGSNNQSEKGGQDENE